LLGSHCKKRELRADPVMIIDVSLLSLTSC
jgi:hypothetical protein